MRLRQPLNTTKKKPAPAVETRESIEDRVAAFLKSGGKIQQIDRGVSGQTQPQRQITIGKR